jgi:hypothetical protein
MVGHSFANERSNSFGPECKFDLRFVDKKCLSLVDRI